MTLYQIEEVEFNVVEIIISWLDNRGLQIAGQISRTRGGCKIKLEFFELLTFQVIFTPRYDLMLQSFPTNNDTTNLDYFLSRNIEC